MALATFLHRLAVAALVAATAACATPQTDRLVAEAGGLPSRVELTDVPFVAQSENYCGPASLAMALGWTGAAADQDTLAGALWTPERLGTLRSDMVAAARRHGRLAVPVTALRDIVAELAAGHPVIVFQNLGLAWYPVWHFAVATGYDLEAGDIVLHSGLEPHLRMPLSTFERTWSRGGDWALVVLPPDRLPASAGREPALRAAAGLERAGRHREAATSYAAIARAWPDSFAARFGLGNAALAAGDHRSAEAGFRAALALDAAAPAAWNNLAYALAGQRRWGEAVVAAERSVALGRGEPTYAETLREVQAWATSAGASPSGRRSTGS